MNNFVKIDVEETHGGVGVYNSAFKWTEWFCHDDVWVHPYNRDGRNGAPHWGRVEEFREWCDDELEREPSINDKWGSVCPSIKIDGAPLNDGWGSDIAGRMCDGFGADETNRWCDCLEDALSTGKPTSIVLKDGRRTIKTTFTPYESITPDASDFGPWADAAMEGLI